GRTMSVATEPAHSSLAANTSASAGRSRVDPAAGWNRRHTDGWALSTLPPTVAVPAVAVPPVAVPAGAGEHARRPPGAQQSCGPGQVPHRPPTDEGRAAIWLLGVHRRADSGQRVLPEVPPPPLWPASSESPRIPVPDRVRSFRAPHRVSVGVEYGFFSVTSDHLRFDIVKRRYRHPSDCQSTLTSQFRCPGARGARSPG